MYLSWWKVYLVKQCHPSSDQNFACLIRDGQKIHMVPWSFSALSSKEFWRTFWALTKKLHVCYNGESSFNVLALLHEMRLWGVVLWRLQLCWGLKDKTGIWLVNTLGRKEPDSYWLIGHRLAVQWEEIFTWHIYFMILGELEEIQ